MEGQGLCCVPHQPQDNLLAQLPDMVAPRFPAANDFRAPENKVVGHWGFSLLWIPFHLAGEVRLRGISRSHWNERAVVLCAKVSA